MRIENAPGEWTGCLRLMRLLAVLNWHAAKTHNKITLWIRQPSIFTVITTYNKHTTLASPQSSAHTPSARRQAAKDARMRALRDERDRLEGPVVERRELIAVEALRFGPVLPEHVLQA